MAPTDVNMAPSHINMTLTDVDMTLSHINMTPTDVDMAPSHINMTPTDVDMTPSHINMARTDVDMTPSHIDIAQSVIGIAALSQEEVRRLITLNLSPGTGAGLSRRVSRRHLLSNFSDYLGFSRYPYT